MSSTLSTLDMAAELLKRVPIGLSLSFAMDKLNLSFRWIEQKGSFIWQLKKSTVTVATNATTFSLPADFESGKVAYLSGPSAPTNLAQEIPYKPWDEAFKYQLDYTSKGPGQYSLWTFTTDTAALPAYAFLATLIPESAKPTSGTLTLPFVYHKKTGTPLALSPTVYFPSPDDFDDIILLRAESEARRINNLVGWEAARQDAESAVGMLIDQYRSTKTGLAGLLDQGKQTQEIQLQKQE